MLQIYTQLPADGDISTDVIYWKTPRPPHANSPSCDLIESVSGELHDET